MVERDTIFNERTYLYSSEGGKSGFDVFVERTGQKREIGKHYAHQIMLTAKEMNLAEGEEIRLMDIGPGGGEVITHCVKELRDRGFNHPISWLFVEPDNNESRELRGRMRQLNTDTLNYPAGIKYSIVSSKWQDFLDSADEAKKENKDIGSYHIISAVHMTYHIPSNDLEMLCERTADLFMKEPESRLWIVARQQDQVYDLYRWYVEEIEGKNFSYNEIFHVSNAIHKITDKKRGLRMGFDKSDAPTEIPFESSPEEAVALLNFLLGLKEDVITNNPQLKRKIYARLARMNENDIIHMSDLTINLTDGIITLKKLAA